MNTDFFKSFLNTLLLNIATIAAVIVGVVSYAYRGARVWYNNGGREFLINAAANFAAGVYKVSERVYYTLEDAEVA
jgi:ABC-type maltose transport system permease subunit